MSIDAIIFANLLGELEAYYKRDFTPFVKRVWYKHLNQHLNTEEFQTAVEQALVSNQFMPTPQALVEAIKGNAETQAMHEWELLIKAAARNDRDMITQLSPQGRSALQLVGGLYKLGLATDEELRWLKKEFVAVWQSTPANTRCLTPSLTADLQPTEMLQELSRKMALNGGTKAR